MGDVGEGWAGLGGVLRSTRKCNDRNKVLSVKNLVRMMEKVCMRQAQQSLFFCRLEYMIEAEQKT